MEVLTNYITNYGIPVFVIACCIIVFIGVLKLCKVFDKISNAEIKKAVYYGLDVILAFAGSAIYFAAFKIPFDFHYAMFSCTQVGATTALYAIYENIGLRKFVRYIIALIQGWISQNPDKKFAKLVEKFGFDASAQKVEALKVAADEKAKAEAEKQANEAKDKNTTENVQKQA